MSVNSIIGGNFIISESDSNSVFIPEEWSEEHEMMAKVCEDFIQKEVIPNLERIDNQEEGLMVNLLNKAGELGLLGITVPEEYGGMASDFKTSLLVTEHLGHGHSFSVAYGAQTGIGTLPLLYYGNKFQKDKYLTKISSGEWKAAYCLTEPNSGSDANSGKTNAKLSEDGKDYILNGQKMWITNGGFADLLTVFAKIDDDDLLSAFLVERNFEGITFNPEEHKMGIKGSSTRQIFFNNVKVPIENLLSERKNGFKIALNILNIGRIKLGAGVLGGSKQTFQHSIQYSLEREQFGRSISKYGAIKQKIAEQFTRIFVLESALYRTGQAIDDKIISLNTEGNSKEVSTLKGIENFAVECAILKVAGSECLDYVVDQAVQIYGGMGYSSESPVERSYRDSRINRIFEGTNEINRLLIVDMLLKKGLKGELNLMQAAQSISTELTNIPSFDESDDKLLSIEKKTLINLKKIVWMITGSAVQKKMQTLSKEQEILLNISNCIIRIYQIESALLRVEKLQNKGVDISKDIRFDILQTYIYDSLDFINKEAKDCILSFAEGDDITLLLMGLKRFSKYKNINPTEIKRKIANFALEKGRYLLN